MISRACCGRRRPLHWVRFFEILIGQSPRISSGVSKLETSRRSPRPFRRAVFRGMDILMPPLLTVVILVWVWTTIEQNVLGPVQNGVRNVIAWAISDIHEQLPDAEADDSTRYGLPIYHHDGKEYLQV